MSINSFEANVLTQLGDDLCNHSNDDATFLLSTEPDKKIPDFPDSPYQNSSSVYDGPEESYAMERVKESPLHKLIK